MALIVDSNPAAAKELLSKSLAFIIYGTVTILILVAFFSGTVRGLRYIAKSCPRLAWFPRLFGIRPPLEQPLGPQDLVDDEFIGEEQAIELGGMPVDRCEPLPPYAEQDRNQIAGAGGMGVGENNAGLQYDVVVPLPNHEDAPPPAYAEELDREGHGFPAAGWPRRPKPTRRPSSRTVRTIPPAIPTFGYHPPPNLRPSSAPPRSALIEAFGPPPELLARLPLAQLPPIEEGSVPLPPSNLSRTQSLNSRFHPSNPYHPSHRRDISPPCQRPALIRRHASFRRDLVMQGQVGGEDLVEDGEQAKTRNAREGSVERDRAFTEMVRLSSESDEVRRDWADVMNGGQGKVEEEVDAEEVREVREEVMEGGVAAELDSVI